MPKLPTNMIKRYSKVDGVRVFQGYQFRKYVNGKPVTRALGMEYEAALVELERYRRELTGERIARGDPHVKEAAALWLEKYVATRRNEKGQKLAAVRVEKFLSPAFGTMRLSRVTKGSIRAFRVELDRRGDLKPQSVKHVLADVRCFFRWCEDEDLIDRSPFPRGIMPRIPERLPDRVTDEEAERLRALPDPHGFACRLALATGLRWGDLTRTQASHVKNGMLEVEVAKTGKVRRIPLPPELLAEIRGRVGRLVPFSRTSNGSFARVAGERAGIAGFHVHQMRHTCGCQYAENGGNLAAAQRILGHASIVTTQRYSQLGDAAVQRDAEQVHARIATVTVSKPSSKVGA